jgi:hypothetical protein
MPSCSVCNDPLKWDYKYDEWYCNMCQVSVMYLTVAEAAQLDSMLDN